MIRFSGYVSHRESLEFVRTADVLFLPMHNLPRGKRSRIVPGKAYEYIASGRPILAAVPDGDARDFLERSGNAILCRPDDTASMAKILNHLYEAWLRNEQAVAFDRTFVTQFERRRLTSTLSRAFDRVLNINSLPREQPARLTT
jgi:glycosyltransferase involved in cell wall biosynthesis